MNIPTATDTTITLLNFQIAMAPEEENPTEMAVVLTSGAPMPAGNQGQAMVWPVGTYRFHLDKDTAMRMAEALKESGEKLTRSSDIAIAPNMDEVERSGLLKGVPGVK